MDTRPFAKKHTPAYSYLAWSHIQNVPLLGLSNCLILVRQVVYSVKMSNEKLKVAGLAPSIL